MGDLMTLCHRLAPTSAQVSLIGMTLRRISNDTAAPLFEYFYQCYLQDAPRRDENYPSPRVQLLVGRVQAKAFRDAHLGILRGVRGHYMLAYTNLVFAIKFDR